MTAKILATRRLLKMVKNPTIITILHNKKTTHTYMYMYTEISTEGGGIPPSPHTHYSMTKFIMQ